MIQNYKELSELLGGDFGDGDKYIVDVCPRPGNLVTTMGTHPAYYIKGFQPYKSVGTVIIEQDMTCEVDAKHTEVCGRRRVQTFVPVPENLKSYTRTRPVLAAWFEQIGRRGVSIGAMGTGGKVYRYISVNPRLISAALTWARIQIQNIDYKCHRDVWKDFVYANCPGIPEDKLGVAWYVFDHMFRYDKDPVDASVFNVNNDKDQHAAAALPVGKPWNNAATFRMRVQPLCWFTQRTASDELKKSVPEDVADDLVHKAQVLATKTSADHYSGNSLMVDSLGNVGMVAMKLTLRAVSEERFIAAMEKQDREL